MDAAQIEAELRKAERVLAKLQSERTAEIEKAVAEGKSAETVSQMRSIDVVIQRENAVFLRSLRERLEAARRDDQVTAGKG